MHDGVLYVVPTPIGNLEDITLRSLRILKGCNTIACENVRHSLKLLSYFNISKTLIHYCSYNEQRQSNNIIKKLHNGKDIALISNAGTPGISDPGYTLLKKMIMNNMKFEVLPGATAFIPALIGSGLPLHSFIFCGFLKRKKSKIKAELYKLQPLRKTIIFYESSHRILNTILICKEIFGDTAQICVARELTKQFEEFIRRTITQVFNIIKNKNHLFGEFVIILSKHISLIEKK
ncbi:MAG: 16S rRNA (cytidine(1402)-2'-O)-methyltransferase [Endomicrobium sp.]|jgi:16S rRNA (cytidine1402-2'-O)-methyltransferase|nr:16S rRNA (cytidine(1402)-2'-O)-methyltransferase [Endomicrobium sp.]